MLNKELFVYDPTKREIPNLGVAKIGRPADDKGWATLRFEFEHFVCEGQYEVGLERILSGFLAHMDRSEQPAVWVSGFYGSGKSHFLKVLDGMWRNAEFPDGARARSLTGLSDRVKKDLVELDNLGKREGGVWSAAGTLGAGASGSPRLAFLNILFAAADLPQRYDKARLVMWMKSEGIEQKVRDLLAAESRDFEHELGNMYVSPHLASALHSALPGFAESAAVVPKLLADQYKLKGSDQDITDQELLSTATDLLELVAEQSGKKGQIPLTLIIMDELQQYLGDDATRTLVVQQIVEAVSSKFGSRVLFVAAGQSAMGATDNLLKLQGRFTGRVEFTDTDVDRVIRRVILQKAPDKRASLEKLLTDVSGEISRHLQGTKLAPVSEDADTMVADYPLLPTRRRFWEHVLRAIDRGGSAAQLRTQLRSVQEATKYVGEMPAGVVVPGDFIYDQQVTGMLHSGVLSKELHEAIEGLKDGSPDGGLKYRLTATVFLIKQLQETNKELGVRATAATLADLLVMNLNDGSAMLRSEVERLLQELADKGVLQSVDGEYLLQSREGSEWQQAYVSRVNRIKDETARIAAARSRLLQDALVRHVGNLAIVQGEAKVPRKGQFVYGQESPDISTGLIPVWVRDEWSVGSLKTAEEEAAARGSEDPVVHLLIPKKDAQSIKEEIVKMQAAQETLDAKGLATTDDGALARAAIQARLEAAEQQLQQLMAGLLRDARVLVSGGNEMTGAELKATVEAGLNVAVKRMFPKFDMGDGKWGLVVKHASEGSGTALDVMGYQGEAKDQKVCKEILGQLTVAQKGAELRDHFKSPPFGWPQDAVDGSLMVLSRAGELRVQLNGVDALPSQVTQDRLGKFTFAREFTVVTAAHRLQLRRLVTEAGVPCKLNEEPEALARFLAALLVLAEKSGGVAPRPRVPDLTMVKSIENLSGNERLLVASEHIDELSTLWTEWDARAKKIEVRMAVWGRLQGLLEKGGLLTEAEDIAKQAQAISDDRVLLVDPDPISPLVTSMTDALRQAVRNGVEKYSAALDHGMNQLKSAPEFAVVPADTWTQVIQTCQLQSPPELLLGTEAEVIAAVDSTPLSAWSDRMDALPGRFGKARQLLSAAVAPKSISYAPPQRLLSTAEEAEAYVSEVRDALLKAIAAGNPVNVGR